MINIYRMIPWERPEIGRPANVEYVYSYLQMAEDCNPNTLKRFLFPQIFGLDSFDPTDKEFLFPYYEEAKKDKSTLLQHVKSLVNQRDKHIIKDEYGIGNKTWLVWFMANSDDGSSPELVVGVEYNRREWRYARITTDEGGIMRCEHVLQLQLPNNSKQGSISFNIPDVYSPIQG